MEKPHERILEHFEKTIEQFTQSILDDTYITKDSLKHKIKACVITSIKGSKIQGTHEAQIITLSEKLKFRLDEYKRLHKEFDFVKKLYIENLNDTEKQDFYKKLNDL